MTWAQYAMIAYYVLTAPLMVKIVWDDETGKEAVFTITSIFWLVVLPALIHWHAGFWSMTP